MSTRSIIVVTDNANMTVRLYKHHDGYPSGNLPIIERALARLTALESKEIARFKSAKPEHGAKALAALIIGESVENISRGPGADYDHDDDKEYPAVSPTELTRATLGNQGDLEFMYVIDTFARTVRVYEGSNQDTVISAPYYTVDLSSQPRDVSEPVRLIEAWGYKVNPTPKPKTASEILAEARSAYESGKTVDIKALLDALVPTPEGQAMPAALTPLPKPVTASTFYPPKLASVPETKFPGESLRPTKAEVAARIATKNSGKK